MSLAITLDKSTFQSLAHNEIVQLYRYYTINVTPLLVSEILGDLSKDEKEAGKVPKEVVVGLANKIFPSNTYVNANYKKLLEISLLGREGNFSNRPFLEAAKSINTGAKRGLVFEETKQEKAISRWREGKMNSLDEIISLFWRKQTTSETVIIDFKEKLKLFSHLRLEKKTGDNDKNLMALKDLLFSELSKEKSQKDYLNFVIDFYGIDPALVSQIFYRWESEDFKSLYEFSPYAFFWLSVVSMYYAGINNNFFSERRTNLLDLEYLYYTPCCQVFSTNDRFLISLFKLLIPKDVFFISSNSLKSDLKRFHQFQEESGQVADQPPVKETETYKIWDTVFDLALSDFLKAHPKSQEQLKAEFEEIIKAAETGEEGDFNSEPDFVVKTFYMQPTDRCVCGSGKQLKDCCLIKGQ